MSEDIPDHLRCTAKTKLGERCRRQKAMGEGFCEKHRQYQPVVEVPAVRAVAPPEKVRTELQEAMAAAGVEIVDDSHLEPVEVMRWVVLKTHSITERLMNLTDTQEFSMRESWPLIRQTLDALEALRKSAEAAESAGMQRRRVAVEEAKAQAVFLALDRAISRAEMAPSLEVRLRAFIGEEMHALSGAA